VGCDPLSRGGELETGCDPLSKGSELEMGVTHSKGSEPKYDVTYSLKKVNWRWL
jgi:hypothetical protein